MKHPTGKVAAPVVLAAIPLAANSDVQAVTSTSGLLSVAGAIFCVIAIPAAGIFAWVFLRWKDEVKRRIDAEDCCFDLRDKMPEIIVEHFQKIETYLDEKMQSAVSRLDKAHENIRQIRTTLEQYRVKYTISVDELQRSQDEIMNMEEELKEVPSFLKMVSDRRAVLQRLIATLNSDNIKPEIIDAAETRMNKKLRRTAAGRTTARVMARHSREMTTAAASTIAKFAEMERKLEKMESALNQINRMRVELPRQVDDRQTWR